MKSSEYYPVFLALLGILFFSMMDAVMKAQALAMGVFAATFWRAAMGALVASILYLPRRPTMASGRVLKLHIMRAVLNALMLCCLFFGLTRIPLAQATSRPILRKSADVSIFMRRLIVRRDSETTALDSGP